ncbi:MAG: TIGR04282 family arsenosugar biosynthesis glycosyltransferase [Burkholderiales bacterium]|nr:TIGR04282 family arsenosugar biosynthesis glycosyltransferase [Burkholderiales bacterium]
MRPPVTVIVMAKAPVAGFAKTRLIPALGAEGAAALAERLLRHAVAEARAVALGRVELCCAPDHHHAAFASLGLLPGVVLSDQGDGDLGARMARAFERRLAGGGPVLMIGTDAPALDAAVLQRAAEALTHDDAVFVPALDGGYALIGLRCAAPSLFSAMPWSTPAVMACTRERLAAAGLRHTELEPLADIDEAADLVHLPKGFLR